VELALGKGKREYDKRYALAEREAKRQMERGVRRDWKSGV
jgi:SsrA-binding protein